MLPSAADWARLGLYRASGHEHFNDSLIIPVLDETGAVSEIYGRTATEHVRAGTPLRLYLPVPHRGMWSEVAVLKRDLSKLLLAPKEWQDKRSKETLPPAETQPEMSERERQAAMTSCFAP